MCSQGPVLLKTWSLPGVDPQQTTSGSVSKQTLLYWLGSHSQTPFPSVPRIPVRFPDSKVTMSRPQQVTKTHPDKDQAHLFWHLSFTERSQVSPFVSGCVPDQGSKQGSIRTAF